LKEYFETIKIILRTISRKAIISEEEISNLETYIENFSKIWPILIGPITPKADEIMFHVIPFLKIYKTIGHFAEEDNEKIHAEINRIMRPLMMMKNKKKKFRLTIKRLVLGRSCFKI
jgi:hypothetical protein